MLRPAHVQWRGHPVADDKHFGEYGGRFVPEALMAALDELDAAFQAALIDPEFTKEL
ncbi:MAG: tryptophan synthase subunit beta, partial [Actinobacteria bacterium]|nr:tryptophan synthase subunit beta [Actinomycetota bacterium]